MVGGYLEGAGVVFAIMIESGQNGSFSGEFAGIITLILLGKRGKIDNVLTFEIEIIFAC